MALRGFKPWHSDTLIRLPPHPLTCFIRPNSDATPRSIAAEPILRTFRQQLDGIQELEQVAEIECLVVPHAHMAPHSGQIAAVAFGMRVAIFFMSSGSISS